MRNKTEIFIITECPYVGILRAMVELSTELNKMDFTVHFVLPKDSRDRYGEQQRNSEKLLSTYGTIHHLPLRRKFWYMLGDLLYLKKFTTHKKDAIFISYTEYAGKLSMILYKIGAIKTLLHAPQCIDVTRKSTYIKRLFEFLFQRLISTWVTSYLACSPSEAKILMDDYAVPSSKIIMLPNYRYIEKRKEKAIYQFTYVGRIVNEKGVRELLKIFDNLGMTNKLLVVGEGPERLSFEKKYPQVLFTGRVSEDKALDYLAKTRFFVSNSKIEGLSYSLIEAMSLGAIPIVSNVPGHSDIVKNGFNGFLFNGTGELEKLIASSKYLTAEKYDNISKNSSASARKLSEIGRESIHKEFKKYETKR